MNNYFLITTFVFVGIISAFAGVHSAQAECEPGTSCPDAVTPAQAPAPATIPSCDPTIQSCIPDSSQVSLIQSRPSGFVALAPITGLTDFSQTAVVNSESLAIFFNNLYKYLIGLAAILAIIQIIWSGIRIALNQDSISTITDSKGHIVQAIFGLVLVLSPVIVFSVINPSILNLSLNLPPLDTASRSSGGNTSQSTTDPDAYRDVIPPANSCVTVHSDQYLETAVCPTIELARAYPCKNGGRRTLQFKSGCRNYDPNAKQCLDTYPVACEGKSVTVVYYFPTHYLGLSYDEKSSKIVPRDTNVESSFTAACAVGGGTVVKFMVGSAYDCPGDANLPIVDSDNQYGFKCANEELTCSMSSS